MLGAWQQVSPVTVQAQPTSSPERAALACLLPQEEVLPVQ